MKFIKTLIICNIAFISACSDSESDSPTGNVSTPTANVVTPAIDGPEQELLLSLINICRCRRAISCRYRRAASPQQKQRT